jgi:hypothetical protein
MWSPTKQKVFEEQITPPVENETPKSPSLGVPDDFSSIGELPVLPDIPDDELSEEATIPSPPLNIELSKSFEFPSLSEVGSLSMFEGLEDVEEEEPDDDDEEPVVEEEEEPEIEEEEEPEIEMRRVDTSIGRQQGEKPKQKWKIRQSFDDLSRDDLLLINDFIQDKMKEHKGLKGRFDPLYKRYRQMRKDARGGDQRWNKASYLRVVNAVLEDDELAAKIGKTKEDFLDEINDELNRNADVYNKLYSGCFIYQLGSISGGPGGTKTFASREVDNQYTGRPGDAPNLFLTDLLNKHKTIFNRYIFNTNNVKNRGDRGNFNIVMRILRKYTGAKAPKIAKFKNLNCWFRYRITGTIVHTKRGIHVEHKSLSVKNADRQRGRQACKTYKTNRTECVPHKRRVEFKKQDTIKIKLKRKTDEGIATSPPVGRRPKKTAQQRRNMREAIVSIEPDQLASEYNQLSPREQLDVIQELGELSDNSLGSDLLSLGLMQGSIEQIERGQASF